MIFFVALRAGTTLTSFAIPFSIGVTTVATLATVIAIATVTTIGTLTAFTTFTGRTLLITLGLLDEHAV